MAALIVAALSPATVVVLFAARGWLNLEHVVILAGLMVLTFAPSYVLADFLLSLFGGARDAATSRIDPVDQRAALAGRRVTPPTRSGGG
jgi:hypothetical protein